MEVVVRGGNYKRSFEIYQVQCRLEVSNLKKYILEQQVVGLQVSLRNALPKAWSPLDNLPLLSACQPLY